MKQWKEKGMEILFLVSAFIEGFPQEPDAFSNLCLCNVGKTQTNVSLPLVTFLVKHPAGHQKHASFPGRAVQPALVDVIG